MIIISHLRRNDRHDWFATRVPKGIGIGCPWISLWVYINKEAKNDNTRATKPKK